MEECDQGYGYILYRTTVTGPGWNDRLFINELRDRAHIFVDGEYLETIQRDRGRFVGQTEKTFDVKPEGTQLDILVENQGRANFAPFMQEYRGITENVFLNDSFVLSNWEHYPLKMDNLENLAWEANDDSIQEKSPAFFKANLKLDGEPCDTYIYPKDWHKGFITVNGFNIGRYWNIGPQYSLYIPAPLLKKSDNEIIIFEEEKPGKEIHFSEKLITDF